MTGRPEELSATKYGTRLRGWRRPALGAFAVFVLAMGGVTAAELMTGQTPSGAKGTTLGNLTQTGSASRHQPGTRGRPEPATRRVTAAGRAVATAPPRPGPVR
ncbi:hypothetical protein PQR15_08390 [Streptomyces lydicus]|nr:hypothetical protein [Streptomyces lydicus]